MSANAGPRAMFWLGWAFLGLFGGITLIRLVSRDEGAENAGEVTRLQRRGNLDAFRAKTDAKAKTGPSTDPKLDPKRLSSSFDWPQWRGPMRDGRSPETGLNLDWTQHEPPIRWRVSLGDGFGSIAVANGRLYTMFQD